MIGCRLSKYRRSAVLHSLDDPSFIQLSVVCQRADPNESHAYAMFIHSTRRLVELVSRSAAICRPARLFSCLRSLVARPMDRHSASLCCIELPPTRRSNPRDRMLDGRRVMENLLGSEDRVIPNPKYIEMVQQSRMTEGMRRQVVEWMLEVSVC